MKKYSRIYISFAIICLFLLSNKKTLAAGTYADEGIAFYAQTSSAGYAIEGTAFYSYKDKQMNTFPVYRFVSTKNGDHFYTASEDEKIILTGNSQSGYTYEGIAFYSETTSNTDLSPVYRFMNTFSGFHFYTSFETEKTALTNNPQWGYQYEGVAFYTHSSQTINTTPVYRFMSPSTGAHFYTASESEKDAISQSPVYRFYNQKTGDHFYTASENEKNILTNTSQYGYVPEGVAFYTSTSRNNDNSPVYRFINLKNGDHFYTSSEDEKTGILNNPLWGYSYEGIAFYAPTIQLVGYSPIYRFVNSTTGDHFYTISKSERYALIVGPLGPEISVGLWPYTKTDIMNSPFTISANKTYNVRNSAGVIVAQVSGNSTTSVGYDDANNQLTVSGPIAKTLAGTNVTFDAADGNNVDMVFNTNRSNYISDWRGNIDKYRGKMKVQYYRGTDIISGNGTTVTQIWVNNILPLEQYAWGSAETSGTGNINHTKVMSTIYRTYGFWYIKYANKYASLGFKIRSDSGSQNYGGYNWEIAHPNIKIAAQNTRGVIATYGNDVALTPYSSWSDGRTRSWQEKWGGTSYPWCQSVSDPYGSNPSQSAASHMVGLIANGSVNLAANYGWSWDRILHYYFTNIGLTGNY